MNSKEGGGLVLEGVWHAYGSRPALEDVSLAVSPGEVLCLLGPSGCGKSTLLRLAAGLEPLQRGRVEIAGRTVADAPGPRGRAGRRAVPPEGRGVGMVFQDYALFPHLTVLENVAFGLDGRAGGPRPERRARAQALLERVELGDRAGSYPHVLSGGEQQRVALARALAPQPAVMLLDEPFQGLDTRLRQRIRDDTLRLLHQSGAAVLLVTHDPEEAMAMGDRLAVLRQGRVQQEGRPGAVYDHPATPFVARFLGDTNSLPGLVKGGAVETPLGPLPAPERSEGEPVEVLLRPEFPDPGGAPRPRRRRASEPERERRHGRSGRGGGSAPGGGSDPDRSAPARVAHLAHLTHVGRKGGAALRAARLGPCDLAPGDRVRVRLDRREALVFPSG